MHWFYIEKSQINGEYISITGSDVNHIKNVLRMSKGERVVICDGEGKDYYCTLQDFSASEIVAKIEDINDTESELQGKIYLFQGIPKKDKMELIIQKAVELGAYEVIPVSMKRCVAKIEDRKKEEKKIERWQSIATSAAKQSGRGIIPKVRNVMRFSEAVAFAKGLDINIVPYEQADNMSETKQMIQKAASQKSIGVFIGPEGGFDESEISAVIEAGFCPVTLGRRILRTETAGLTILSVLMFELEKERDSIV
ncbi:16S rRNA (uracil(1498)-N(3))-methyltransferase [Anaeromicropila populeti]|uniref:Ribosomal RNA small subunit methyltransferase E n=1 Tax=Anaeromicropila populeti TaxID=37658 RepID=A0A1I6IPI4_9FIRM|nr:16S rRNA (uracil(1498)-N(3))-methyltransferase [Anaeromicropila populeti]SFR68665.1 16S rRNA (uracil1498-N3)-methyltransferase [Anaeromicropila populeti]